VDSLLLSNVDLDQEVPALFGRQVMLSTSDEFARTHHQKREISISLYQIIVKTLFINTENLLIASSRQVKSKFKKFFETYSYYARSFSKNCYTLK
jgi:hypothetical protein